MNDTTLAFVEAAGLLLLLLNPFLLVVYLAGILEKFSLRQYVSVLARAGLISTCVFALFALLGHVMFERLLRAQFASFQIFGGVIFLLIGVRFVFQGEVAIEALRGETAHVAGAIAMPILIGPGTISASVVAGKLLPPLMAVLAIAWAVLVCIATMIVLKVIHDWVRPRNEGFVKRYIEVVGRISALVVGTYAIEMIMTGLMHWWTRMVAP